VSPAGPVSPAALRRLHLAAADYFLARSTRRPGRPADWRSVQPYGRFFTVRHYLRGPEGLQVEDWQTEHFEAMDRALVLLQDLGWLQATLGDEPVQSARDRGENRP
jgi:hypothetical protein